MTRGDPAATLAGIAAERGITDGRLLQAMRDVDRRGFVPAGYSKLAGCDSPIPIGRGQVTTQPSLAAAMIEAVGPGEADTVLEVGTGYGYQTALLARLAGHVWSVERHADLARAARANLARAGITNATVVTGDGTGGLPEHAPYDAVVVSAAFPSVPRPLLDQLAPGGRLVQPVGPGGDERVNLYVREAGRLRLVRLVTHACFVPLVEGDEADSSIPHAAPSDPSPT